LVDASACFERSTQIMREDSRILSVVLEDSLMPRSDHLLLHL
jgi:hypothetical protein